jgi:hypothetical protein
MLADALRAKGWTVTTQMGPFEKGGERIDFDTNHWMIVSSKNNPRKFDVPVPDEYHAAWTVNLIEHLCRMEDKSERLRTAHRSIRDDSDAKSESRSVATGALEQCYHRWLVDLSVPEGQMGRVFSTACGCTAVEPNHPEPSAAPDPAG